MKNPILAPAVDALTRYLSRPFMPRVILVLAVISLSASIRASAEERNNDTVTTPKPTPTPHRREKTVRISACNELEAETVNFAIAYLVDMDRTTADPIVVVEGWFQAAPGKCRYIEMNSRLKKWRGPLSDQRGVFLIYGETGGILNKVWEGEDRDPEYCIRKVGNFAYKQNTFQKRQCVGSNHERVRFSPITNVRSTRFYTALQWNFLK